MLIGQLAATGDARVVPALEAFAAGDLYVRKSDNLVFMTKPAGSDFTLIDPLTGESAGSAPKAAVSKIRVNNNLRRVIRAAMGGLTLLQKTTKAMDQCPRFTGSSTGKDH